MKKILFFITLILLLTSCTYTYHDYDIDGDSFIKINWYDDEPYYIETNGLVPDRFYWNTYYITEPTDYVIYYEYIEHSFFGDIIYPYEVEIEVFYYEGEYNNNGDDVYFELILYPDGYVDYFHEVDLKNEVLDVTKKTLIGTKTDRKENKEVTYKYYKLPSRKLSN